MKRHTYIAYDLEGKELNRGDSIRKLSLKMGVTDSVIVSRVKRKVFKKSMFKYDYTKFNVERVDRI